MNIKYTHNWENEPKTDSLEEIVLNTTYDYSGGGIAENADRKAVISIKLTEALMEVLYKKRVINSKDVKTILCNIGCPINKKSEFKIEK